jgi:hypothetical protein
MARAPLEQKPKRPTPPRDKTAANLMAIGLFFAAGGLIYYWTALQLHMGWLTETDFSATYIADTGPYDPYTAKDVGKLSLIATVMFVGGGGLLTLGVRRMLAISRRRDASSS